MVLKRRPNVRTMRGRTPTGVRIANVQNLALQGTGPAMSITGVIPLPLNLTVTVSVGILGVGLVDVALNGQTIISGLLSAATLILTGLLAGLTLNLSTGLYLGNTYVLVLA